MKFKELQGKSDAELHKLLAQNREKLRDLNFRIAHKEVKNHQEYKVVRRQIARIKTMIKQRAIANKVSK
ncbi:unnamed protein product [marine sediment metagenome]|uniref:50S ribosomal protein L29 n=1 Tax=marine sediment metagenome TaxID=412755 RepID=X1DFM1_9ZZZZ